MKHLRTFALFAFATALSACAYIELPTRRVGGDAEYYVVTAKGKDTAASLAAEFLGDADKAWIIEDVNGIETVSRGRKIAIPRGAFTLPPLEGEKYQTVPILTYHRFTKGAYRDDRLEISAKDFERQLSYLKKNGYRIISMAQLRDHLNGRAPIPRRAVVLTIDDGFRSAYTVAFPLLKKYNAPATIYVYSDFVGAGSALKWDHMKEMTASGLVDIQPHSKTHANFALKLDGETDKAYRKRIREELSVPARLFKKRLGVNAHSFAYPYGAVNAEIAAMAEKAGYDTAVTVLRGANASYADPYLLKRRMVFGDHTMSDFQRFLKVEAGA
ncbi:MAG: polysaccharide deacetylase family protein [Pseudomonadota bacterium]